MIRLSRESPEPSTRLTPNSGSVPRGEGVEHDLDPGCRAAARTRLRPHLLHQHLGGVVVAGQQHLLHDRAHRLRVDAGDLVAELADADGRSLTDRDATFAQHLGEHLGGAQRRVGGDVAGSVVGVAEPAVVHHQRVDRTGLEPVEGRVPARVEVLVVVAARIAEHATVHA